FFWIICAIFVFSHFFLCLYFETKFIFNSFCKSFFKIGLPFWQMTFRKSPMTKYIVDKSDLDHSLIFCVYNGTHEGLMDWNFLCFWPIIFPRFAHFFVRST